MLRFAVRLAIAAALLCVPLRSAADTFCDTAVEDCRERLLALIANETVGIDVAFWFMEDDRLAQALQRAVQERNVRVRVIFDSEALPGHPTRQFVADRLVNAGIPMREKVNSGINHWKLMIFAHQNVVQFSGANYTDEAFVPIQPYVNYVDEVIYYSDTLSIVNSFKTRFDDVWTDTTGMLANYANVTTIERAHATSDLDSELKFSPFDSFRDWSVYYNWQESTRIDAIIYRITDRAHTDSLIYNLVTRHVPFRLITEPYQYRDESRFWHAWNVDRLYAAGQEHAIGNQPGIQVRHRLHAGLLHEKLTLMIGQGRTVLGSSNWTSASSDDQLEHNLFSTNPEFFTWSRAHFERKWNNSGPAPETEAFVPLPPHTPVLFGPPNGAPEQPVTVTLQWSAGPWAHRYDVFVGTDPSNLVKIVDDQELGPYDKEITVSNLLRGTRYYWRVVSRTMANLSRTSDTSSFITVGSAPPPTPPSVALTSPVGGASYTAPAVVTLSANAIDDGAVVRVDFLAGSTVVGSATSAPFSTTWSQVPAGTYSVTARALDDQGLTTTSSAISINVSPGAPETLPAPWSHQDIGAVAYAGSASAGGGSWTVTGSGSDVWDNTDQFTFVYQSLTNDGTIIARVATVQDVHVWTKAGVMIRESLTPESPHGFMIVTPGPTKGLAFQRRTTTWGASTHTTGGEGAPPTWVKLTRSKDTFTASTSTDGVNWTVVGSDTIPMTSTVYAGLAVVSHDNSALATATFDNVSVTTTSIPPNVAPEVSLTSPAQGVAFTAPASVSVAASAWDLDGSISRVDFYAGSTFLGSDATSPYTLAWGNLDAGSYVITARATDNLGAESVSEAVTILVTAPQPPAGLPGGWSHQDIGGVGAAGNAAYEDGTFTVTGSGADIWGTSDAFHFTYRTMTNGAIVARVASLEYADRWTKAGVMIRASLTAGSRHAMMIASPGKGFAFQRRTVDDGASVHTAGPAATAPGWVRLERMGSTITASTSFDGVTWAVVGTETIDLPDTVYVGLPVTSHIDGVTAVATIDNVSVSP